MARTDAHSPSNIVPTDYEFVTCFGLRREIDGWPVPAFGIENTIGLRAKAAEEGVRFSPVHSGLNVCDVCGAHFLDGAVWRHVPTGDYLTLGHTCADKYELASEVYTTELRATMRLKKQTIAAALRRRDRLNAIRDARAFLASDPELKRALRSRHHIVSDIRRRLLRSGGCSSAQRDLVLKIAREEAERAAEQANRPADVAIPDSMLNGRVRVEGTVLAVRIRDGMYGLEIKMLLQIEAEGGAFRLWGSVPSAIDEDGLKGCRVAFVARLERSRGDAAFGFYKRPSKAEILRKPEEA